MSAADATPPADGTADGTSDCTADSTTAKKTWIFKSFFQNHLRKVFHTKFKYF